MERNPSLEVDSWASAILNLPIVIHQTMPSSCPLFKKAYSNHLAFFSFSLFTVFSKISSAADTITPGQSFADGHTLISSDGVFVLGFFGSQGRYLGIWYHNISVVTAVWVANRDSPLSSTGGALSLSDNGNLVLGDRSGIMLWSTNTSSTGNPTLRLLDTGNLVLSGSHGIVWQSFDHPTDTFLPKMKIGWDLRTNFEWYLTSWKSDSDPTTGTFSFRMNPHGAPQMFIWDGTTKINRNGPWNGQVFGIHLDIPYAFLNMTLISNKYETYYTYEMVNGSILTRLVMNHSGQVDRLVWAGNEWRSIWKFPMDDCDAYARCRANGFCDLSSLPYCKCLPGFEPRSPEDWDLGDASEGCFRSKAIGCGSADEFLRLSQMKLPDSSNATMVGGVSLSECRALCAKNCPCLAFAVIGDGSVCLMWDGELLDLRRIAGGDDLYIRRQASELGGGSKAKRRLALIIGIIVVPLLISIAGIFSCFYWKQKGSKGRRSEQHLLVFGHSRAAAERPISEMELGKDWLHDCELPLIPFSTIVTSTNNFSNQNKLGEGGFGPVYKGKFPHGPEVAVKKLSKSSVQGIKEFANEIRVIAMLQHKNLVRLLGCCITSQERMLVYEYMPNKSLDCSLFGPNKIKPLDWQNRMRIIEGVAQGLLYLHKYSRLKIIHRDLKASNILLDAEMNPKISDFGIARIFSASQEQAKTNMVMGTYGYMPPEYVVRGLFSDKYDVFSFGVLMLEIVSGMKSGVIHHVEDSWNLLRHAWDCWKDDRLKELMDPVLSESCPLHEVTRCVHVALLCVQETASDRPTMSSVVNLLSGDTEALPAPGNIAFSTGASQTNANPHSSRLDNCSSNRLTSSSICPR